MAEIVLTTLNAKYIHASFGLRYLRANLRQYRDRSSILEFDIHQRASDIVERILARRPRVVGIGVYIWNARECLEVATILKTVRPEIMLVIGGPEVSHETDEQTIAHLADYVIRGEADIAFYELCDAILSGSPPTQKVIDAILPEFAPGRAGALPLSAERGTLVLPYDLYDDEDIANRIVYVEASRGCPFKCEFCLSSLDVPVRNVPIDAFLDAMQKLLDRGVQHFKFVDRTFNLNLATSSAILKFFLDRYRDGLFLHFEMIPDRLPDGLKELIRQFPAGALQFEVGIQSFNPEVEKLISRRQDHAKLEANLRWLRQETGVHVHADLIAGLPGEDLASFARGFDRLVELNPQEIQVGILKRLRGTPIVRHSDAWGMKYSPVPPYEVLETKLVSFEQMQSMRRFSRIWDLVANSGNFVDTLAAWRSVAMARAQGENEPESRGPTAMSFTTFMRLTNFVVAQTGATHAVALNTLARLVFEFLTQELALDRKKVADAIWSDWQRAGRSDMPPFLHGLVAKADTRRIKRNRLAGRQARHLR